MVERYEEKGPKMEKGLRRFVGLQKRRFFPVFDRNASKEAESNYLEEVEERCRALLWLVWRKMWAKIGWIICYFCTSAVSSFPKIEDKCNQ